MEEEKEKDNLPAGFGGAFVRLLRKDFIVYIVALVAVLICMLTYLNGVMLLEQCNNNCVQQFEEKCIDSEAVYNHSQANNSLPILVLDNWGSGE